jgi:N-dimethylarginine dimethylaminohydrolase
MLQTRISGYFRSNVEGLATLKNLCVNNFEKILKFRLKGRFLRAEHILTCFVGVLDSLLARCPEKQL